MANGKETISGTHGFLWINNVQIAELISINASIEPNREDVQYGMGVDSKLVGLVGTGEYVLGKVYSRASETIKQWKKGNDGRFTISFQVADPDTPGKQIERHSIVECWHNELTLADWEKGAISQETFSFGFNPENHTQDNEIK